MTGPSFNNPDNSPEGVGPADSGFMDLAPPTRFPDSAFKSWLAEVCASGDSLTSDRADFYCSYLRENMAYFSREQVLHIKSDLCDLAAVLILQGAKEAGTRYLSIAREATRGFMTANSPIELYLEEFNVLPNAIKKCLIAVMEGNTAAAGGQFRSWSLNPQQPKYKVEELIDATKGLLIRGAPNDSLTILAEIVAYGHSLSDLVSNKIPVSPEQMTQAVRWGLQFTIPHKLLKDIQRDLSLGQTRAIVQAAATIAEERSSPEVVAPSRELLRLALQLLPDKDRQELCSDLSLILPIAAQRATVGGQAIRLLAEREVDLKYSRADGRDFCALLKRSDVSQNHKLAVAFVMAKETAYFDGRTENWTARRRILREALKDLPEHLIMRLGEKSLPILARQSQCDSATLIDTLKNEIESGATYDYADVTDAEELMIRAKFTPSDYQQIQDICVTAIFNSPIQAHDPRYYFLFQLMRVCHAKIISNQKQAQNGTVVDSKPVTADNLTEQLSLRITGQPGLTFTDVESIAELNLGSETCTAALPIIREGLLNSSDSLRAGPWRKLHLFVVERQEQRQRTQANYEPHQIAERPGHLGTLLNIHYCPDQSVALPMTLPLFAERFDVKGLVVTWHAAAYPDGSEAQILDRTDELIAELRAGIDDGPAGRAFDNLPGCQLSIGFVPSIDAVQLNIGYKFGDDLSPNKNLAASIAAVKSHLSQLGYEFVSFREI